MRCMELVEMMTRFGVGVSTLARPIETGQV